MQLSGAPPAIEMSRVVGVAIVCLQGYWFNIYYIMTRREHHFQTHEKGSVGAIFTAPSIPDALNALAMWQT